MAIEAINDVSMFTPNNGVTNDTSTYKTISPAFKFNAATYAMRDASRSHNEVVKFWIRIDDVNNASFKMMLGCDVNGNGQAIQFDFTSSTAKKVQYVNQSGFDVAFDNVIWERELTGITNFISDTWIECELMINVNKMRLRMGGRTVVDTLQFAPTGNYWGFCGLTGSSYFIVSDVFYVTDQILYGNVNVNGAPDPEGVVYVYEQTTYTNIGKVKCDENGEWMYFVDDDPVNLNKYFLYGRITDLHLVQPRGACNITI